jgi:hypothetical protein
VGWVQRDKGEGATWRLDDAGRHVEEWKESIKTLLLSVDRFGSMAFQEQEPEQKAKSG